LVSLPIHGFEVAYSDILDGILVHDEFPCSQHGRYLIGSRPALNNATGFFLLRTTGWLSRRDACYCALQLAMEVGDIRWRRGTGIPAKMGVHRFAGFG